MRSWLIALLLAATAGCVHALPDPERAFEDRDMATVERWLEGLPGDRRDSLDALRARAWLARRDGDTDRALALIDEALARAPAAAELRVDRAAIRSDQLADAGAFKSMRIARGVRRDLEAAVESEPGHVDALVALITFHREAPGIVGGDPAKARELMPRLREASESHFQLQRAMQAAETGDFEAAVAAIRSALDEQTDPPLKWRLRLGNWLAELGRAEPARDAYLEVLARDPGFRPALRALGALSAESGIDPELGIDALRRFVGSPGWSADPSPAAAWRDLARLYDETDRPEAAREAFERYESLAEESGTGRPRSAQRR